MEQILILSHDPAGTRDWLCQTLGLREGDHPDFGFAVTLNDTGLREQAQLARECFPPALGTDSHGRMDQPNSSVNGSWLTIG